MRTATQNRFQPDYAIHPGALLSETLGSVGMKGSEFASRASLTQKTVSQIIQGKARISPQSAIYFERVLGISATIWNNLQAFYDLHEAQSEDQRQFVEEKEWAKRFPINALVHRKAFSKPIGMEDRVAKLFDFFGVANLPAWNKCYGDLAPAWRKANSFESKHEATTAWLRLAVLEGRRILTAEYDESEFRKTLEHIRGLTRKSPNVFLQEIRRLCAKAGVRFVDVSELPGVRVSGAACWISGSYPLIALSHRYRKNDHFWFSFFHEAGHILLHRKKDTFIDRLGEGTTSEMEKEANRFARNLLIPQRYYLNLAERSPFISRRDVEALADEIQIAPGILVGQLQHDKKIEFSSLNDLKRTVFPK